MQSELFKSLKATSRNKGVTVYPSFFKARGQKSALHIEIYIETVEQSDYKMERSGLKQSDHGMKWP